MISPAQAQSWRARMSQAVIQVDHVNSNNPPAATFVQTVWMDNTTQRFSKEYQAVHSFSQKSLTAIPHLSTICQHMNFQ